jgi:hypothetical protein
MAWGFIRVAVFATAFLAGMVFSGSGHADSDRPPVLSEDAGSSLLVACKDGQVVVAPLQARQDAIQLHCLKSGMVVVRDHARQPEKIPYINRIHTYLQ